MDTLTVGQTDQIRQQLLEQSAELTARLERINANLSRPLDADSKERAVELENSEVVDALGNEARSEMAKISAALQRLSAGKYGFCLSCGEAIEHQRLLAYPSADECIECATAHDRK